MDRYLTNQKAGTRSGTKQTVPEASLQKNAKMADGGQTASRGNQDPLTSCQPVDYGKIATEVAKLIQTTIANTVELAITKALTDLKNEVQEQAGVIANTEQRMINRR